jgi:Cu2+-exporting ATPase
LLFAIESQSEHPLAGSIVNYLKTQEIQGTKIAQFESITGLGIKAIHNGETYYVGNQRLIENNNIVLDGDLKSEANSWKDQAQTVVYFANSNQVLAIIGIKDQIKASSKSAIHQLQKSGIEVHMLTGDNLQTAEAVGNELSITNIRAEVLPSDKSEYVKNLQAQGKVVAMVGDGINDSEALAQADISIAMGHGSDIAMDVAKMTLITSDLEKISQAFKLSHLTVMGIRQNLFWAFIYNLIGIPIAAGLLYPINGFLLDPMIAGAAMAFSSVSVVLNSLRLKRIQLN